ncbi:TetR/AcrR family transcriptional regulator [Winogradskyella litoriviva]|uniref:TetR/AcrR family transcriptional regulator n=1 Tax=Winogradskyella litoriviva TaxID=1220182 RepID=A0ABX2E7F0_9FLAO|nr:TetR/AcrR family transcriptional regulator [Winogradskyella litoriviva]NRD23636.1 TetR/AcrR family transcriptional regulator [Winogradskyella litoriviva]
MKHKIKTEAISLFNTLGFSVVSMKQIADKLGISAGNLRYHYLNKEALLKVIYTEMYDETLDYILPENTYITLFHFEEMMQKFDNLQQRYAFFFKDIVHISTVYPSISKQYEASNLVRFKDARKLIDYYVESGRMVPETQTIDYDQVIYTIWMISTFWQAQKQTMKTEQYEVNKRPCIEIQWNLLLPYLTEKGMSEYQELRKFIKTTTK